MAETQILAPDPAVREERRGRPQKKKDEYEWVGKEETGSLTERTKRIEVLAGGSCRSSSEDCETAKPIKNPRVHIALTAVRRTRSHGDESKRRVTMASAEPSV